MQKRLCAAPVVGALLVVVAMVMVFPSTAQATVSYSAEEIAVVQLINEYRVGKGLDALLVSDLLSDAAKKHSSDMEKYGYMSHLSGISDWFPFGSNQRYRVTACGYPSNAPTVGENVGQGFVTAEAIFNAWKYSDSHNQNMLSPVWKVIGVGLVGCSWTTDFGCYADGTAHENGGATPPDITAPAVTITAPVPGEDVSGLVTVAVIATDNLGVAQVRLNVDGNLIATDDAAPYAIVWDTTNLNPGTHVLRADAVDAAGNVGSTTRQVHVSSVPGVSPSTSTTTTTDPATTSTTTTSTTTTSTTTTSTTTTSTTAPHPTTTTTTAATPPFADVPTGSAFYEPIAVLAAAGVVSGYSNGMFYPSNPVTRAQFTKIIILALERHTPEIEHASNPTFSDVAYTGGEYPFDFVEEAAAHNIIKGFSDGTFAPEARVTRLQLALMMVRAGGEELAKVPAGYSFPFKDVPAYAREALAVAHYNGLLSGRSATVFDPYAQATRGHVAKMVHCLVETLRGEDVE